MRKKTPKGKDPLPETMTEREAAEFWDTHSVTDYLDELEPVEEEIVVAAPRKRLLSVRLDEADLEALRQEATRRGLGASTLARLWIVERLRREAVRAE